MVWIRNAINTAGILAEIAVLFIFPHSLSKVELWCLVAANVAIGAGLIIEFACIHVAITANREIKTESDAKLAEALDRAAKAEEGLIRFRTPRRNLMQGKWAAFSAQLRTFAGTRFDAGIGEGGELAHFWWDFAHALADAGWVHIAWMDRSGVYRVQHPLPPSGSVPGMNVEIHIHPQSRAALQPAATALIAALQSGGIEAADAGFNAHSTNADAIHIVIGDKW